MLLHVVARGRIGRGPEADLVERYLSRVAWPTRVLELPESGGRLPTRPQGGRLVLLDEAGTNMSSTEFAGRLETWRDDGVREIQFRIGGADGFGDRDRDEADLLLSFGRATWPHLLARAMLAEQLWRATSIIAGHPYHREG